MKILEIVVGAVLLFSVLVAYAKLFDNTWWEALEISFFISVIGLLLVSGIGLITMGLTP